MRSADAALRTVLAAAFLGAALLAGVPAHGQEPADAAPASTAEQDSSSPREALERFLGAMRAYDRRGALALVADDGALAGLPAGRDLELVTQLYDALNRVEFVDLDGLPGPGLAAARHEEVFGPPPGHDATLRFAFVRTDTGWRISADTLLGAAAAWERVSGLPPLTTLVERLPFLERLQYRLRAALPGPLLQRSFVLENWQWLALALLALLAATCDRVARFAIRRLIVRLTRTRLEKLDEEDLLGFERPAGLFSAALVFGLLLPAVGLDRSAADLLDLAASAVATLAGVWAAYRLVDVFCGYLELRAAASASRFDDMLVPLLRRTLKIFVFVVGVVFIASRLTDEVWGVVAGLGIGSLAVGFAARDSIENLFGTFTVLLDKPFQIGDWIQVGDLEGTVEEVGFRSTRIRTFYDSKITVPNRTFISSNVDNLGERRYRRIKTTLSLTYDTPPEKIEAFCEGVRQILRSHPYSRKDYYHVYLNGFGASSLDVLLYCFVEAPDWSTELREKHRLFADVLRLAERLEVDFAFPTQTLHVARPEDLEHPDRPKSDGEGQRRGRAAADEIVAAVHRGEKPPPVRIERTPVAETGGPEKPA